MYIAARDIAQMGVEGRAVVLNISRAVILTAARAIRRHMPRAEAPHSARGRGDHRDGIHATALGDIVPGKNLFDSEKERMTAWCHGRSRPRGKRERLVRQPRRRDEDSLAVLITKARQRHSPGRARRSKPRAFLHEHLLPST